MFPKWRREKLLHLKDPEQRTWKTFEKKGSEKETLEDQKADSREEKEDPREGQKVAGSSKKESQ